MIINKVFIYFMFLWTYIYAVHTSEFEKSFNKDVTNRGEYVVIGSHEYYVGSRFEYVNNSFQASEICNEKQMKLVSIETEEENFLILSYLVVSGNGFGAYWSSGMKRGDEWWWTGVNETFSFTYWNLAEGQPDYTGPGEICMYFGGNFGWWDGSCAETISYICE